MTNYDDTSIEKDSAELAAEQGFTGTFAGFIAWLEGALIYGGVRVHEKAPNDFGRLVTVVETVTGGYSSDESLLGRLRRALWPNASWVRSERGGLTVYEFADWLTDSDEEREWLAPEDGVFEQVYRARTLRVVDASGATHEFEYDGGVEMLFVEPDRDIINPAGVVTVRPAPALDLPWERDGDHPAQPATDPTIEELAEALGLELPTEEQARPKPKPPTRALIPEAQRERSTEGRWHFTHLAREQVRGLEQTTADIAALLDSAHVSVTAPSGTATNHYVDDLLILVALDEPRIISVVESDEDRPRRREPSASLWAPVVKAPSGGTGRTMPTTSKEFDRLLVQHGFELSRGGSHPQATHPDHPDVRVTIPGTPSDSRSFMNTVALLKRLTGIDITRKAD